MEHSSILLIYAIKMFKNQMIQNVRITKPQLLFNATIVKQNLWLPISLKGKGHWNNNHLHHLQQCVQKQNKLLICLDRHADLSHPSKIAGHTDGSCILFRSAWGHLAFGSLSWLPGSWNRINSSPLSLVTPVLSCPLLLFKGKGQSDYHS